MKVMDVHSYSRPDLIRVRHLELEFDLNFDRKVLDGSVKLHFESTEQPELVLDTRDLDVHSVENANGWSLPKPPANATPFCTRNLRPSMPEAGSPCRIRLRSA